MLKEYQKISTIYKRNEETKKLDESEYSNNYFKYLKNNKWIFTEKIDGTNIRIYWDGYKVNFYGRTDKAEIPNNLKIKLKKLFGDEVNEQIFEQNFEDKKVILFGEGYGGKIQKGKQYQNNEEFILFDVCINGVFLKYEDIVNIAEIFKIKIVPLILIGTLEEAVKWVKEKNLTKLGGTAIAEGLVGKPILELSDNMGKRIITKIKYVDFC